MYRLFVEGPKEFPILIGRRANKQKAAREAKSLIGEYKKAWVEDEEQRRVYSCWKAGDKVCSRNEVTRLPSIVSGSDVVTLINSFPDNVIGKRNRTALILLYRCGLRISEVSNLSLTDVDLQTGLVKVRRGKGGKDRFVPIDPDTIRYLREWDEIRESHKWKYRSVWFLVSRDGKKLCTKTIQEAVREASEKTGVYLTDGERQQPIHAHVLRHCFATELLDQGFTLREVQELLGHSNIGTTMVYTHVSLPNLKEKFRERKW